MIIASHIYSRVQLRTSVTYIYCVLISSTRNRLPTPSCIYSYVQFIQTQSVCTLIESHNQLKLHATWRQRALQMRREPRLIKQLNRGPGIARQGATPQPDDAAPKINKCANNFRERKVSSGAAHRICGFLVIINICTHYS